MDLRGLLLQLYMSMPSKCDGGLAVLGFGSEHSTTAAFAVN
jgi:hypothetical protein